MGMVLDRLKPLSAGQEAMLSALRDPEAEIVGIFGPSGSGKSLFSIAYGVDSIINGRFKRFLIVKPLVNVVSGVGIGVEIGREVFEGLVLDYLRDLASTLQIEGDLEDLFRRRSIQIVDLHYLKGRTFDDSLVFIDDIQNMPAESVIEILTRVGNRSKLIVAGDPVFQRLKRVERDSSAIIREILLGEEKARVVDLGLADVVRPGARRGLKLFMELILRSRSMSDEEKRVASIIPHHAPDADIVTVFDVTKAKETYGVKGEGVPDILIFTKTPGRLIGKGGERIQKIEKEIGKKVRGVELVLDFKEWIRSIHPVTWVYKHVIGADFAGPRLRIRIDREAAGAFIGQGGSHIRFLEYIFEGLLGIGVEVEQVEVKTEREKKRK
ncbi:KH type 2 domain protein [Desulfurococcaceae archaeon AG1]|jgi:phosphate starvation-inducible PhoH-like protein|nr:MAG: phosphate starvation-inducible protein PhoH [Desulfurococcaceae archaeon]GAY25466.1 KH type 2 domain protein [Desulfurococcaceae archaeon AG1]